MTAVPRFAGAARVNGALAVAIALVLAASVVSMHTNYALSAWTAAVREVARAALDASRVVDANRLAGATDACRAIPTNDAITCSDGAITARLASSAGDRRVVIVLKRGPNDCAWQCSASGDVRGLPSACVRRRTVAS